MLIDLKNWVERHSPKYLLCRSSFDCFVYSFESGSGSGGRQQSWFDEVHWSL